MSEKNYQSPNGPGLNIDDFHPSTDLRGANYSPSQIKNNRYKLDVQMQQQRLSGGVVGHQQYGNWQENNHLYQKGAATGHDMFGGAQSAKAVGRKKRPQSSNQMHKNRSGKPGRRIRNETQFMGHSNSNWSPSLAGNPMMMPQMMGHPQMQAFGPPPMMPHFDPMAASLGGLTPFPQHFSTLSDAGGMTAATSHTQSVYEETERKNKAKIELLEKKIRAKDQLFEDALASTVASSCGCGGSSQLENKSLTAELKKRFLKLKAKHTDAEQEIHRLTKTVKVVEVEVREDTEPLREEISKLQNEKFDLQQTTSRQTEQITDQRLKIEEMERERGQRMIDDERHRGEVQLFQERIRSLEEELRFKVSELEAAQTEIRDFREAHSNFEIQISRLQSELSEASLYKDWYESKQKEYDELMKQLEDEQRKLYDKEDEIVAINDKVTQVEESNQELKETITEKNERIKELEEELAKRPEIKDDSSSTSEEKPDFSAEMEEWKKKYEALDAKHTKLVSEYEKFQIKANSEIEELSISVANLEKRNVELKLLLRRNNIALDGSPTKVGSATGTDLVAQASLDVTTTNQVVNQVISTTEVHNVSSTVVEEHHESKTKKTKKTIKEEVSEEDSASDRRDKKRSKKHKKKRRRSSSSSSYSSRRSRSVDRHRTRSKGEQSVRFDRAEDSFFDKQHGQTSAHQASLLISKSQTDFQAVVNERAQQLETTVEETRKSLQQKEAQIQEYLITIEELRTEILSFEKKADEEAKNNSFLGKLQGAVNDAMYKKKYEDVSKRLTLQQEEFNSQIKRIEENLVEKERELHDVVKTNEMNILMVTSKEVTKGEPVFHRIELQNAQIEVREKKIFLDKTVIEASDQAKVTVLDRERKLIKAQFQKLFKKQIQDLEANVLAYQDLLLTKEVMIKRMEKELLEREGDNKHSHLQAEVHNLKKVLEEKLTIIEELRARTGGDWCADHDSEDELTAGTCTRAKLKRRVYKKIEHLNEKIRNEVMPEIHERYAIEIKALKEQHINEIEGMEREHKIALYNKSQSYEMNIREWAAEAKKFQDINKNLEETIDRKQEKIDEQLQLAEEQAARLGELMTENKKLETLHEGKIKRLEQSHGSAIQELRRSHQLELRQLGLEKHKIEELYEELKQVTFQSDNSNGKLDFLKRENEEMKLQVARLLKTEKKLDEECYQKDSQIQELLDYRKQWNLAKFQKLEEMIEALEKEQAALKAKYKHKVIVKTETIRAELGKENVSLRSELERIRELLYQREEELNPLYTRVEELEMMQSSQSLEVKDVHARYRVLISQLKSENASIQQKYLTKIESVQLSLQKETLRVEKAYLDKIEWYKTNEKAVREEEKIKADHRVEEALQVKQVEIDRLIMTINLYKEKLTRRESENRNILVELKIYKDKVETIRQDFIEEIQALKAELELKRKEYLNRENELNAIIQSYKYTVDEMKSEIESYKLMRIELDQQIIELRNINQTYILQIEQFKLEITQLKAQIEQLLLQIKELQNRPVGTKVVEKIIEKIVYRDREVQKAESEEEKDVSEHESIEEQFEVVGRVKVGESTSAFANLERDDI